MVQCTGLTKEGLQCKRMCQGDSQKCYIHQGDQCSVCLVQMTPQNSRRLDCGHTFHSGCLERWKRRSHTCPMCRAPFDQPRYKVKISIEPDGIEHETITSNIQSLVDTFGLDSNFERFVSTISFSVMNENDLGSILQEIGFVPPGMNFSSFNTERRTEL